MTTEPATGRLPRAEALQDARAAVSPRRAFWLSFALFFCLFTLWAVGNPLTAAPDEPSHATKAGAVVRGYLVGEPVEGDPDGPRSVYVPNLIWQSQAYPMCYYFKPNVPASCEPAEPDDPGRIVYAITTASNYNPLYYSVTGFPSLLPLGNGMLYLMRLVSAAICAFAMAWGVRSLAELREMSWPVLGLAAATTPMVVFLAGTISPSGPEICLAIALWAALLVIVHRPDPTRVRSRMAGIAVLASVLVNLRGMSPLFLAIIVATVVGSAPWANTWKTLSDRRSWPWLGLVAVASCAALVWLRTAGAVTTDTVHFPELGFVPAAKTSVHETPAYLRNMVGQFGWMDTDLPLALILGWLGVIAVIALAALVRGTVRERLALLSLGLVTLGLPVLIHASQAKYIGLVWQGRYFLPAAVGIPLLAGFMLRGRETSPRSAHRFLPWGLGALLLAQLVALAVNLHRYAVGVDGPWWPLPADAWRPPIAIPVLLLTCAAVLILLFRLLTRVGRELTPGTATAANTATATATTAVVVVNWNGADVLEPCLASLRSDAAAGTEVIVVDNASTDGSPDLVKRVLPSAVLVRREHNDGFAAGVNAGIAATTADIVLLLNSDAIASPGWVAAITAPFAADDDRHLAAVTGRVLLTGHLAPAPPGPTPATALRDHAGRAWVRVPPDAPGARRLVNSTGNEVTRSGNGRDRGWLTPVDGPEADREVFGFNGGSVALRRAALADIGGLDESLFMYYEDTDASWRLRRRGWRIEHAPDAVTEHRHAASSGTASEFFAVHNVRNRLVVALRHMPWPVVARAYGRTLARAALGPHRDWWLRALGGALRRVPADLRTRRRVDSTARLPRTEVARHLVPET